MKAEGERREPLMGMSELESTGEETENSAER